MSPQREFLSIFASAVLLGSEGKASGNPLRIILVKTHAEAKQILKRLARGEFFSCLAKQYSLGLSSQAGRPSTTSTRSAMFSSLSARWTNSSTARASRVSARKWAWMRQPNIPQRASPGLGPMKLIWTPM